MNDASANIARLRKRKNWSQSRLANEAGMSQATVSRLEKSEGPISLRAVAKIARALEVDVNEIVSQEELRLQFFEGQDVESFFAFCPSALCPTNTRKRKKNGVIGIYYESGKTYPSGAWDETNFCPQCRAELVKDCVSCSRRLTGPARYCVSCGNELVEVPGKEIVKKIIEEELLDVDEMDDIPF